MQSFIFRSKDRRSSRKPRQRRARLCVNTKPRIRVTNVSSGARRGRRGEEEEEGDSEAEEEVYSNQSDAGETDTLLWVWVNLVQVI